MFKFIKKCDNTDLYVLAHIIKWALAQMANVLDPKLIMRKIYQFMSN